MKNIIQLVIIALLVSCSGNKKESSTADMIVHNATITTLDENQPNAEAIAVKDGKILAVGNSKEILKLKSDSTQIIDAEGRRIIPGLIDSHSHFLRSGLSYTRELRWDGVPTLKVGLEMIKKAAKITPEGEWVRVIGGWTPWQFKEQRLPTPAELTEASPNRPVYMQYFYSAGIVNKKGLEVLGITKETPDPYQGRFERDSNGNPTGLMLAEPHPGIFYGKIAALPSTTKEVEANSTIHMFRELARYGLTGVIDAGGGGFNYPKEYSTAEQLAADGKLAIRTSFYLFAQKPKRELQDFTAWSDANKAGKNTDPHKKHGFELEGAGEYILWEAADYENFRWERPELPETMGENLEPILKLLIERRWPFKVHSTYNESIQKILTVLEKVNKDTPLNGLRWSIEHGETITPETVDRIVVLGGGLALQDRMVFLGDDYVERYGAAAGKYSPPLRYIYDKGIPVGMGTDGTRGGSFNPFVSLHYMVSGKTASGRQLYDKDNVLTREEALRVHTIGSAWFSQEEDVKGRIKKGQFADFVVLSKDYMMVVEDDIKTIESVLTIVNGKPVYGAEKYKYLAPKAPKILPEWSPVKLFGSYYKEN
jgi:predicted amidohydrolase YtcJ